MSDMVLGLSLLIVVFDDSKTRTRRLGVINALTTSIMREQQHGPMMATALEELKRLMNAKAAWLRVLENGKLVIAQHIGIPAFLQDRLSIPMEDSFERTLSDGGPIVVAPASVDESGTVILSDEGFHHVVVVPVRGKKSVIGTLNLGSPRGVSYTVDDMEFLTTTAQQVGIAFENMKLVEQVLRSHRQWANTFDSIQDVVLVHDSEYRVMRANRALLSAWPALPQILPANLAKKSCRIPVRSGKAARIARLVRTVSTKGATCVLVAPRWFRLLPT